MFYIENNPGRTAREIALALRISELQISSYINQANKSIYAREHNEQLISSGNGYTLMSKSSELEQLSALNLRLRQSLNTMVNTKPLSYECKKSSLEGYLKITTNLVPQIMTTLKDILKSPTKEEQIKFLENRIKKLQSEGEYGTN